jgi:hypothetical protein
MPLASSPVPELDVVSFAFRTFAVWSDIAILLEFVVGRIKLRSSMISSQVSNGLALIGWSGLFA